MTLLQEIMHRDRDAAAVLKRAKLNTDKDLRTLTRQDLQELIPGAENFRLRRDIFDIIYKQQPVERVLRELKEFIPDQSFRDALTNNGVLLDYLQILKDMKSHMNSVQSFLDAHIGLLEEFSPNPPDQKSTRNDLPDQKSTRYDPPDQKLTRYDPPDQKSTRYDPPDQKSTRYDPPDQKSTGYNPPDQKSTRYDLPDKKSTRHNPPDQKSTRYDPLKPQPAGRPLMAQDTSDSSGQMVRPTGGHPQGARGPIDINDQTDVCEQEQQGTGSRDNHGPTAALPSQSANHPQQPQSSSSGTGSRDNHGPTAALPSQSANHPQQPQTTLVYQALVAGKTFGAHVQLMEKVKEQVPRPIQFIERNEDYQITFVFCPISSRIAADVEAALADVKGNKPVILVLMHHTREAKCTPAMRTWNDDSRVLFHVNVFYHETQRGLLKCEQNNAAASEIRHKLLKCFFGSGNVQAVGADSDLTGSTSGRDGRNTKGSDSDRSSSGPNWWSRISSSK